MIRSYFLALISLFLCISGNSQIWRDIKVGYGIDLGYRCVSAEAGGVVQIKYRDKISATAGFAFSKFGGVGFSIGTNYSVQIQKIKPTVGIAFNSLSGKEFYQGSTNVNRTDYSVKRSNYFLGFLGGLIRINYEEKNDKSFLEVMPYISYRLVDKSVKAIRISGVVNEEAKDRIDRRIGAGVGFGIKLVHNFGSTRRSD